MAKKSKKLTDSDIETFKQAVKGVQPLILKQERVEKPRSRVPFQKRVTTEALVFTSQKSNLPPVHSEDFLLYKQDSIDNKTLRKLRKGQYNVEAVLDLHGMSIDTAEKAVNRFLQECLQCEMRVVLIIHGKGRHQEMPILKNKLNQWLRDTSIILAFCSATIAHGDRGAMYVLLKRTRGDAFE